MDIIKILQEELGIRRGQVETTIKLIDEVTRFHSLPDTEKK